MAEVQQSEPEIFTDEVRTHACLPDCNAWRVLGALILLSIFITRAEGSAEGQGRQPGPARGDGQHLLLAREKGEQRRASFVDGW